MSPTSGHRPVRAVSASPCNRGVLTMVRAHRSLALTAAIASVAALGLTACSGGTGSSSAGGGAGDGSGKKVSRIKLVAAEYSKDHTAAFWKQFAEKYKQKTGIDLDVQVVSWDTIDQTSSTMLQNNNAPDILNLNAYASYAKDGLPYNGKLYGFPDLSSARAFFYNKAIFTKAGIAAPPKTWAELEADAKRISALGDGSIGYALPLGPEESQGEFSMWLFNNNGSWKKDGKWTINSPENVQTLGFLKKLTDEKVTQNNPGKTNRADAFNLFASGKVGMVVGFSPLAGQLDKAGTVQYGVAPMPTQASEPQTFGVTDYLMAFKKPGNQEAVKAFYDLYYQKDQVNQFIKAEGFLPVTRSGLDFFKDDAKLKVYLDTLPNAH